MTPTNKRCQLILFRSLFIEDLTTKKKIPCYVHSTLTHIIASYDIIKIILLQNVCVESYSGGKNWQQINFFYVDVMENDGVERYNKIDLLLNKIGIFLCLFFSSDSISGRFIDFSWLDINFLKCKLFYVYKLFISENFTCRKITNLSRNSI